MNVCVFDDCRNMLKKINCFLFFKVDFMLLIILHVKVKYRLWWYFMIYLVLSLSICFVYTIYEWNDWCEIVYFVYVLCPFLFFVFVFLLLILHCLIFPIELSILNIFTLNQVIYWCIIVILWKWLTFIYMLYFYFI